MPVGHFIKLSRRQGKDHQYLGVNRDTLLYSLFFLLQRLITANPPRSDTPGGR